MSAMREYSVLFLLRKEERKVYMEISFARDLGAVLRKHWCGEVPRTREYFSCENPWAKPEMLVWKIGYASREEAGAFLQKWEEAFLEKGFEIITSQVDKANIREIEKNWMYSRRLKEISFDNLMQGVDVQRVTCRKETRKKKEAAQKYTLEAAEDVINIRTTWRVSHAFRTFCKERGLTQSQGLSLLVETANAGITDELLIRDLQGRLHRADAKNINNEELICRLRKELQEERGSKRYPREVHAARIQDMLIKKFFAYLPKPQFTEAYMKRYSVKLSETVFPDKKEYNFPDKDGVYLLYLEHVGYVKGHRKLLLIYGKTAKGEKLKLCYPYAREHRYGQTLWNSQYLIQGYPWGFGVQRPKEIAYIVGALPLFDLERISDWYVEWDMDEEPSRMPLYEGISSDNEIEDLLDEKLEEQGERKTEMMYSVDNQPESLDERIEFAQIVGRKDE